MRGQSPFIGLKLEMTQARSARIGNTVVVRFLGKLSLAKSLRRFVFFKGIEVSLSWDGDTMGIMLTAP
jgi:hypothetical protein